MTVDQKSLLKDLQRQVRVLEGDVRARATEEAEVADRLRREHTRAVEVGRTAVSFSEWRDAQVTQAAVAWVLGTVFVRFCEDNGLIHDPWISGPGDRRRQAAERETAWLLQNSHENQRGWLLAAFDHLASHPAVAALFDPKHNPLHRLAISADASESLISFWRSASEAGVLDHDFTDPDLSTRFLGDLYQDLSEAARKQYALLQTPEFVEELILDLTLDPAIETFGLDGLRLIDPTCGSGHFLLGAFQRLFDRWGRERPGMDLRERVQAALDSIHGVDINPFASAIARFRLTLAALKASGLHRLTDAPGYDLHIGTGDSLLYEQGRQGELFDTGLGEHQYASEDLAEHPDILKPGRYHVVVGNPPYITVKDRALNEAYRGAYPTCSGKYALSVPFAELFFRLAARDKDRAGFVGQITSNSFMKREFGKKLIEQFFPTIDLSYVIDTSGAYIPGHGTPTVILVGRGRHPRATNLRAVLGIRGEPSAPADPAMGFVWRSIVEHLSEPGFENDYISVADVLRQRLATHPWSVSGGGADDLMAALGLARTARLRDRVESIGFGLITGDDEVYSSERPTPSWQQAHAEIRTFVEGDRVRDFGIHDAGVAVFPYEGGRAATRLATSPVFWPYRSNLRSGLAFGKTREDRDLEWFEYTLPSWARIKASLLIAFAFVATHNHFVMDRGGKVFKQSAPVIKLPEGATEDEHLELLGLLNSSAACFWLKQVSHGKGNGGVNEGYRGDDWEEFYEFTGTKLQEFPLPNGAPTAISRRLDELSRRLKGHDLSELHPHEAPTRQFLDEAHEQHQSIRAEMVSLQEELDWEVYSLYGLVDEDLTYRGADLPGLLLGERAFEVLMARQLLSEGEASSPWFERHGGTPTAEPSAQWPEEYRALNVRRQTVIQERPYLRLLERPEFKRRWASESWEAREQRALGGWLLTRLEAPELWGDNAGRPQPQSIAQLADRLAGDADFLSVLDLWTGRSGSDVVKELTRLLVDEHVPFLAALRYKDSGLRVRAEWESTWELQRREDAGEKVGTIAVPPKYKPVDFARPSYWRHRGKLDVPKERFISYPGAERGADSSLVLGWAGWNHAEQALALAALALGRAQTDAWEAVQLTPLWAGVAELEPWVKQWHSDVDPRMGTSPAQAVTATLDRELARLGLTRDDVAAWRPAPATRGRRAATPRG
ncbi:BREX-2 system adenine-specific DNA-methyltransferase PglX [Knoellia sp. CPCC 206450]|uniref:BREX-2 system adenine-specific DNA-methyltransferase PglX n=1 Tax=Knoellia tibetensis TaxID=3404798 RepID=UPI003B43770F